MFYPNCHGRRYSKYKFRVPKWRKWCHAVFENWLMLSGLIHWTLTWANYVKQHRFLENTVFRGSYCGLFVKKSPGFSWKDWSFHPLTRPKESLLPFFCYYLPFNTHDNDAYSYIINVIIFIPKCRRWGGGSWKLRGYGGGGHENFGSRDRGGHENLVNSHPNILDPPLP